MKSTIEAWLRLLAQSETIPEDIKALYFGIFDLAVGGYGLYLLGAIDYDSGCDDWACDGDYEPANKYLLFSKGDFAALSHKDFGNAVQSALKEILKDGDPDIRRYLGKRIVTWGFDEGDIKRLR